MTDIQTILSEARRVADGAHPNSIVVRMIAAVEGLTEERDKWLSRCAQFEGEAEVLREERDAAASRLNSKGMSCTPDQDMIRLTNERDAALARAELAERLFEEHNQSALALLSERDAANENLTVAHIAGYEDGKASMYARMTKLDAVADAARNHVRSQGHTLCDCSLCEAVRALDAPEPPTEEEGE